MKKLLFTILLIASIAIQGQTPAQNYSRQFTYGYDAVYSGDWRFVPANLISTNQHVIDSITNKSFGAFDEIVNDGYVELSFKISAYSPVILISFTIDDSDGFTKSFTKSENSTNGIDGTWSDIPFVLQNWEYHTNTAQTIAFKTRSTDTWIKLKWTNAAIGTLTIKDVGIFKLNTKPWLRNDIWLGLGASIQNSAINTTQANIYAREQFGRDPLIINLGYPGKTISYLADSVHKMIESNPYAGYAFVHMGGNDVSNSRPYSGVDQSFKDDFTSNTKQVIRELDKAGIVTLYGRLSFRRYDTSPSVENGVYEENGSLPYNQNLIEPIIEQFNSRAYHNDSKDRPILDFYGHTMLDSANLNVDGIHLTTDGKINWRNYVVDVVGDYIYNHVKIDTLYYRTWLENCSHYVSEAETTTLNADIVTAQYYVTKLPLSGEKTVFQNRIDAIVCMDCSITNVYVNIGGNTLSGWNVLSSRTAGTNINDLLDDGSGSTGIGVKTVSGWDADGAGYTSSGYQTGDDSGYFPDIVLEKAWYLRAIEKDVTFYNLDNSKTYTIEILPSRLSVGKRLTSYRIESDSLAVDGEDNYLNYATFENVSPINNEIKINVRNGSVFDPVNEDSGYGYINGLKIYWSN